MAPNEYELQMVQLRYRELIDEASAHRLVRATSPGAPRKPGLLAQLRALTARAVILRAFRAAPTTAPTTGQAKAAA
jgi:hypothetical protein